jgi:hypothetical protein
MTRAKAQRRKGREKQAYLILKKLCAFAALRENLFVNCGRQKSGTNRPWQEYRVTQLQSLLEVANS